MELNYRVAQTPGAAHIKREFGYESGPLTPAIVNAAGKTAKVTNLQKQLRIALNRHDAKIRANKVEIERLTLEAQENGLTDVAQIDKYVSRAIVAGAKYDQHVIDLTQKLQHELGLVKVQSASTQTLENISFRQQLLLIRANHQAKGQIQQNGFQQTLKEIQASPQKAVVMQQKRSAFNDYINAKDFDPVPNMAGGSGGGGSNSANNSKGLLGSLFDYFTGRN